jgi:hypothetical protein
VRHQRDVSLALADSEEDVRAIRERLAFIARVAPCTSGLVWTRTSPSATPVCAVTDAAIAGSTARPPARFAIACAAASSGDIAAG